MKCCEYGPGDHIHNTFFFIVTYELDQSFRVFATTKPFQPFVMKHCSLLDPFVSYNENEVL